MPLPATQNDAEDGNDKAKSLEDWQTFYAETPVKLAEQISRKKQQGHANSYCLKFAALRDVVNGVKNANRKKLVTDDQLKEFLYKKKYRASSFGSDRIRALTNHLFVNHILPAVEPVKEEDALRNAAESLRAFLRIKDGTMEELTLRATGNYWVYRPSQHQPGNFLRGLLSLARMPGTPLAIKATERIRTRTEPNGFPQISHSDGFLLQHGRFPVLITSRRIATSIIDQLQMERATLQYTLISSALTNDDGLFISMTGLLSTAYSLGQASSVPIVFERVAPDCEETGEVKEKIIEERVGMLGAEEIEALRTTILRRLRVTCDDDIIKI